MFSNDSPENKPPSCAMAAEVPNQMNPTPPMTLTALVVYILPECIPRSYAEPLFPPGELFLKIDEVNLKIDVVNIWDWSISQIFRSLFEYGEVLRYLSRLSSAARASLCRRRPSVTLHCLVCTMNRLPSTPQMIALTGAFYIISMTALNIHNQRRAAEAAAANAAEGAQDDETANVTLETDGGAVTLPAATPSEPPAEIGAGPQMATPQQNRKDAHHARAVRLWNEHMQNVPQPVPGVPAVSGRDTPGYVRLVDALEIELGPRAGWGRKTSEEMRDALLRVPGWQSRSIIYPGYLSMTC